MSVSQSSVVFLYFMCEDVQKSISCNIPRSSHSEADRESDSFKAIVMYSCAENDFRELCNLSSVLIVKSISLCPRLSAHGTNHEEAGGVKKKRRGNGCEEETTTSNMKTLNSTHQPSSFGRENEGKTQKKGGAAN